MDYKKTAADVLEKVGGAENVISVAHCLTRLRFTLKDNSIVNDEEVSKVDGVVQVVRQSGQVQVVIGTAVSNVYKEVMKLGTFEKGTVPKEEAGSDKKEGIVSKIFAYLSSSMVAILPAMIAGGIVKAFLTIATLPALSLIDTAGTTYKLVSFMGNAPFYFLPVLVAYGVAKHQKSSIPLAITCAAFLLYPDLAATLQEGVSMFGIGITACSYSSTVFPALLGTFCLKYIENFCDRFIPNVVRTTFKPLVVVLVAIPLYLLVVGPLGYNMGVALQGVVTYLYNNWGWPTITLLAIVMPFIVATGMHTAALVPLLIATNAATGQEAIIIPAMFCANMAIAGSCLGVSVFSKNRRTKEAAAPSAFTAFLGITEPALYGTSIRLKAPLACGCIAAGVAGLYAGISKLYSTTLSASLLSFIGFMGKNETGNFINGLITLCITVGLSFVLTGLAYKKGLVHDSFDEA